MFVSKEVSEYRNQFERDTNLTISVKNLGLRFYVNPNYAFTFKGMYNNFFEKDLLDDSLKAKGLNRYKWVWRNLNFSVRSGDVIAIMGANGEGKTTLLRVLSGLLAADEGCIATRYKPYLLSAGIGFRDELSGYENIRLGSLFLGSNPQEIREGAKQIAEFAELSHEDMSKPVKYYSDGMRARLVFSVATYSEKKILFLDEILGAGDIGFQKKARNRMEQLMKSANTIMLVSHSKEFVLSCATKAMLIHQGKLVDFGDTKQIVAEYERICSRGN